MIMADIKTATPKLSATIGGGATGKGNVTSVNKKIGDVVLTASDIHFLDGENFQEKYNKDELRGKKGDKGDTGNSPKASILQDADGATITVIDDNGTTTAKLNNGTDGVSPTASVVQGDGEATITVTDGKGTTTAVLKDGKTYDDTQVKANTKAINEGVPYKTLTGKSVTANDVSSYKHPVECKITNVKNLIPLAYKTVEEPDIKWIVNSDGSISLTANKETYTPFTIALNLKLSRGTYTFSGCQNGELNTYRMEVTKSNGGSLLARITDKPLSFVLEEDTNVNVKAFYMGNNFDAKNIVFKPQIEEGSIATPYEPYVDVEKVKVQRTGKNAFNPDATFDAIHTRYEKISTGIRIFNNYAEQDAYRQLWVKTDIPSANLGLYELLCNIEVSNVSLKPVVSLRTKNDGYVWCQFVMHETVTFPDVSLSTYVDFTNIIIQKKDNLDESYEPYHEPQTLTPNPDGTVTGMTSVSPTMIVTTDNPNANLSVKYQLQPTNQIQTNEARVITAEMKIAELEKKLQAALMSMGGNV